MTHSNLSRPSPSVYCGISETWALKSPTNGNGAQEALPPPPPVIPPNVVPVRAEGDQPPEPVKKKVMRVPIARRGLANKGQKIQLLTNHFKVGVNNVDGHFFHYSCFGLRRWSPC
ncbi:protein argonaute 4 [Quercus suber]|uniref:Protein argonaute 4 n=1 Tax=Quercus suber TaxID=58331 RepID=A0AAW0LP00_QUESU